MSKPTFQNLVIVIRGLKMPDDENIDFFLVAANQLTIGQKAGMRTPKELIFAFYKATEH
jgi:hypothetical protein